MVIRRPALRHAGSLTGVSSPPEITYTSCRQCGTEIAGLDGRYACTVCDWVNRYDEGHRPLPSAEDDPDHPGPAT
ncbi:hypothetical protein ACFWC2_14365 [Streptomyces diastaticus]|uniref:hypothetical protein n=1 Tax=Streptomyces diastaticus TaxID=1956 RepID=UPI00364DD412